MGVNMRLLKLAVISFIILFIVITAISSLLPRDVLVSCAVDINTRVDSARKQVNYLPNWNNWMPLDESVSFAYNDRNHTLQSGNTIISIVSASDSVLVTNWKTGTNKMTAQFRIIPQPNDIVTVQWQMEERIGWWPW